MTTTVHLVDDLTVYDITCDVFRWNTNRGRNRTIDKIQAGRASLSIHNYDRDYDPDFATATSDLLLETGDVALQENGDNLLIEFPATTAGAYGLMRPGLGIVIYEGPVVIYTGVIYDFDYEWKNGGIATVIPKVTDNLGVLGNQTFLEHTAAELDMPGERIDSVLDRDEVQFNGDRDIGDGVTVLQGDEVRVGTNVLNYLQKVAETDQGWLYAARDNTVTYLDRHARGSLAFIEELLLAETGDRLLQENGDSILLDESSPVFVAESNDITTTSAIVFESIGVRFGTELLFFQVAVTRAGGVTQTATNQAAADLHPELGVRQLSISGVLHQLDSQAENMADALVARYSQTTGVIDRMVVNMEALTDSQRGSMARLEIADIVAVQFTPTCEGGTVNQELTIEGMKWTGGRYQATKVEFRFAEYQPLDNVLILDDADFGVLDQNELAY